MTMKREIEFRGKTAKGEWVYGSFLQLEYLKTHTYIVDRYGTIEEDNIEGMEEVIPETVGQYVGIKDKNGKKVYVGDIVKDEYGRIMEVVWRENLAKFSFKLIKATGKKWTENFLYADMGEWFELENHLPKVIGNIFDRESDNDG